MKRRTRLETAPRVAEKDASAEAPAAVDRHVLTVSLAAGVVTAAALQTPLPWPGSTDATYFIAGLRDYDLIRLQPQWPGYPVYMALAAGLQSTGLGAAQALHLTSAVGAGASVALSGLIAAALNPTHGLKGAALACLLLATSAAAVLTGGEIYSDTTGLALGLGAALAAIRGSGLLAGVLAGLSLGARPSELPALTMLAALPRPAWKAALTGLTLSVAAWLGTQLAVLGWTDYLQAARTHLTGHYDRWGGGLSGRPSAQWWPQIREGLQVFWTHGLGGWWPAADLASPLRLGALLWPTLLALAWIYRPPDRRAQPPSDQTPPQGNRPRTLIGWTLVVTVIWTALNHDIRLDRYWLTPVALLSIWIASAPRLWNTRQWQARNTAIAVLGGLLLIQATSLRQLNLRSAPAEYLAAQWAAAQGAPGTVIILSETASPLMGQAAPLQTITRLKPELSRPEQRQLATTATALQRQGKQVFLITEEGSVAPKGWSLAHRSGRPLQVRSREAHEVDVYRPELKDTLSQ